MRKYFAQIIQQIEFSSNLIFNEILVKTNWIDKF